MIPQQEQNKADAPQQADQVRPGSIDASWQMALDRIQKAEGGADVPGDRTQDWNTIFAAINKEAVESPSNAGQMALTVASQTKSDSPQNKAAWNLFNESVTTFDRQGVTEAAVELLSDAVIAGFKADAVQKQIAEAQAANDPVKVKSIEAKNPNSVDPIPQSVNASNMNNLLAELGTQTMESAREAAHTLAGVIKQPSSRGTPNEPLLWNIFGQDVAQMAHIDSSMEKDDIKNHVLDLEVAVNDIRKIYQSLGANDTQHKAMINTIVQAEIVPAITAASAAGVSIPQDLRKNLEALQQSYSGSPDSVTPPLPTGTPPAGLSRPPSPDL